MTAPIKKVGFRYCQGSEKGQYAFELRIKQQRPRLPDDLATPLPDVLYVYYGNNDLIAQLVKERNAIEQEGQWRPRLPDLGKPEKRDMIITTAQNEVLSDFKPSETLGEVFPLIFAELDKFLDNPNTFQPELQSMSLMEQADLSGLFDFLTTNSHVEWIYFEHKIKEILKNVEINLREIYVDSETHPSHLARK